MAADHVFIMQCVVTISIIVISTALIFFPPNDASFTIGVAMLSSITGYWFPNPNRKQQNSSGNSSETDTTTDSNNSATDTGNSINLGSVMSGLTNRRRHRNTRNETSNSNGNDNDNDSHSVNINVGDDNGNNESKPKRKIQGLSKSVMETVSKMESEGVSYIHVDGQSPQQHKEIPSTENNDENNDENDENDGVNDAHIAV